MVQEGKAVRDDPQDEHWGKDGLGMQDPHGPRGGRRANGGTSKEESTSRDPPALFLLLCLKRGESYGHRLEEGLMEEPGFDGMRLGDMYRALWRMEQDGLVLCDREGGGFRLPQRRFELTELGEAYLKFLAHSLAGYGEETELCGRLYDEVPAPARGRE